MAEFDHMVANPTALNPQPSRLMIPYNGIQMQAEWVSHTWAAWSTTFRIDFLHWISPSIHSFSNPQNSTYHPIQWLQWQFSIRSSQIQQLSILNPQSSRLMTHFNQLKMQSERVTHRWATWSNRPPTLTPSIYSFPLIKTHKLQLQHITDSPVLQSTTENFHKTENFRLDQTRTKIRKQEMYYSLGALRITSHHINRRVLTPELTKH